MRFFRTTICFFSVTLVFAVLCGALPAWEETNDDLKYKFEVPEGWQKLSQEDADEIGARMAYRRGAAMASSPGINLLLAGPTKLGLKKIVEEFDEDWRDRILGFFSADSLDEIDVKVDRKRSMLIRTMAGKTKSGENIKLLEVYCPGKLGTVIFCMYSTESKFDSSNAIFEKFLDSFSFEEDQGYEARGIEESERTWAIMVILFYVACVIAVLGVIYFIIKAVVRSRSLN